MKLQQRPVDHRTLMRKVEQVVAAIDRSEEVMDTVHTAVDAITAIFREELGIYGGRIYEREDDAYVLRTTFGEVKSLPAGLRVPRGYAPVDLCLLRGIIVMDDTDPGVDRALESALGVRQFAGIEVGDEQFILAFNVTQGVDRDEIYLSLGIVRRSINQKIRRGRLEDVFRQAQEIQASIQPQTPPHFPPYDIAGRNVPMEGVGGDLFDYISITDRILGLAIADSAGHGLPAALQARDIYIGLRMGMARDYKIVRTVERLNHIIHQSTMTSRFVSLFYGELESTGTLIYVNAGHPPPFHLARDGTARFLSAGGPVLGPLVDAVYDRGFVHLEPGDMLVMATDGITEAPRGDGDGERGEELGVERLLAVARACRGQSAAAVMTAIFARVEAWTGGAPSNDDRTVVVVVYPE